jgi:hypothetical protein
MEDPEKRIERLTYNMKLIQGARTIEEMANILQCSAPTYRRRLRHPEELTIEEIWRLCEYTGVKVIDFIGGTLKIWGVLV